MLFFFFELQNVFHLPEVSAFNIQNLFLFEILFIKKLIFKQDFSLYGRIKADCNMATIWYVQI